ncbi:hypothetical protein GCM10027444_17970 [Actinopolyspora lacussalsi]
MGVRAVTDARRNSVAECDGADSHSAATPPNPPDICRIFGSNTTDSSNDSIPKISLPAYGPMTVALVDTAFSGAILSYRIGENEPRTHSWSARSALDGIETGKQPHRGGLTTR